jgi:hypothetical protein
MKIPETENASIVMVGSFNPAIFQPLWMGAQNLIRREEAETADIRVISTEVTDFSTEWFQLQVLKNRFMILSTDPMHYAPLRDLAAELFLLLPYTPVQLLGLNKTLHFKVPSNEAWHRIGHLLAPKEPWNAIMETPGLRSMLIQGRHKQPGGGVLQIKVEPSVPVQQGLRVDVNEEFKAPEDAQSDGARWIRNPLAERWDEILKFADQAAEHLLDL